MKEIFAQLLQSQLLTEETANQIEAALQEHIQSAVEAARQEAITEAQVNLAKQWDSERTALVESIDQRLTEQLQPEVTALKETIEEFNNMKVTLSKKMLAKERQLREQVETELKTLAEDIDGFLSEVVAKEMDALKDQIKTISEDNFGRRIFKAFVNEYVSKHHDGDQINESFNNLKSKLSEALQENATLRSKFAAAERKSKITKLLAPLSGEHRKIMEAVLAPVPTEKLDESYKSFLSRVLKPSEKESKAEVLAETKTDKSTSSVQEQTVVTEGVEVTGDSASVPATVSANKGVDEEYLNHIRRVAGIRYS